MLCLLFFIGWSELSSSLCLFDELEVLLIDGSSSFFVDLSVFFSFFCLSDDSDVEETWLSVEAWALEGCASVRIVRIVSERMVRVAPDLSLLESMSTVASTDPIK